MMALPDGRATRVERGDRAATAAGMVVTAREKPGRGCASCRATALTVTKASSATSAPASDARRARPMDLEVCERQDDGPLIDPRLGRGGGVDRATDPDVDGRVWGRSEAADRPEGGTERRRAGGVVARPAPERRREAGRNQDHAPPDRLDVLGRHRERERDTD